MVTIGQIPRKTQAFFQGLAGHFSHGAFGHFWGLVLAMTIGHGSTIDRLALDLPDRQAGGRDEQGQRNNDKVLRLPSISQLKARMRQIVWREAVEDVVKHSHEKPVLRRLERLLAA